MYGLKQSGRNWNTHLHSFEQNFTQSDSDPCVYTRHCEKAIVIIIIWVDDILIATNSRCVMDNVKRSLKHRFQMKDLDNISFFLGIQFVCEKGVIKMNQARYIEKLLLRFNMNNCKPRSTPCEIGINNVCDEEAELADSRLYREIIGSLIYIMIATRPDLCYIVTKLSQYMARPTVNHLSMAKHVLRYLKGTISNCLTFKKSDSFNLFGFCDADWANCSDRRSITGYVFSLSNSGPPVAWKSRKQQTVALSTCEAEYMALASAVQESKFLSKLLKSILGYKFSDSVTLFCDNQSALALAKNPIQHQRSKHIDVKYHFIRGEVQKGFVNLVYVPSEKNLADVFTKAMTNVKLKNFSDLLMGMST